MKKNVTISKDCLIFQHFMAHSRSFLEWVLLLFGAKEAMNQVAVHFQRNFYQKS
jgi:hypothetical protein